MKPAVEPTDARHSSRPPASPMSPDATAFVAASVLLAAASTYLVLTAAHVALPQYLPREHRWAFEVPPGAIGMDWFARAAGTLLAGALAVPLGRAIGARSPWARTPRAARLLFGLAFGAMGFAALYTVLALATTPRGRAPEPDAPAARDDAPP